MISVGWSSSPRPAGGGACPCDWPGAWTASKAWVAGVGTGVARGALGAGTGLALDGAGTPAPGPTVVGVAGARGGEAGTAGAAGGVAG